MEDSPGFEGGDGGDVSTCHICGIKEKKGVVLRFVLCKYCDNILCMKCYNIVRVCDIQDKIEKIIKDNWLDDSMKNATGFNWKRLRNIIGLGYCSYCADRLFVNIERFVEAVNTGKDIMEIRQVLGI